MEPDNTDGFSPYILSSQVGYDTDDPVRILIRGSHRSDVPLDATLRISQPSKGTEIEAPANYWGEKWGAHWWIVDATGLLTVGRFEVQLVAFAKVVAIGDPIEIDDSKLRNECFHVISHDYLETRSDQARTGLGWKDCGSDLQEFSSHAVCTDGICDVLEVGRHTISADAARFLENQLNRGGRYMAHLQDKATKLELGNGCVIHEDRDRDVVTGNVAKAAAIFARVSRLLTQHSPETSREYLERAKRAFDWIEHHGPVLPSGSQAFFPFVHGAPAGSVPPTDQWMTRDLLTMLRAAIELARVDETTFKPKAIHYADMIMQRQVSEEHDEDGLYGHFYTYDNFESFGDIEFTEKANIHCGAWSDDGRIYNKGGHYPHYLLPFIDMLKRWPDHSGAVGWKQCLHDFCFSYFIPACERSPFLILPAGYYVGEGLTYFGSWYHAHNNIYAFAASLALEFRRLFNDKRLRDIAVANIQWIAGLNCGRYERESGDETGDGSDTSGDGSDERYLPVSMIYGIGARFRGSWSKIPGSVCNGFSASPQFKISPIDAKSDIPMYFDDEAYIAHSLPFLAAITRLSVYRDRSCDAVSC
jgi:hypothetical protein